MKVFRLSCSQGHDFEGWFASADEFDRQHAGGEVRCPLCDDQSVARLPSAPYVNTGARGTQTMPVVARDPVSAPELSAALAKLKSYVATHTEDVGRMFPEVARRIHYGEESSRGIRGRVSADEAVELREEGIDAVPLPPGIVLDEELH
ncbi:MAG: DUF1178 family protein [Betaproteobacteria bacterium]|nr:DUF1178 family protein [Betaproteobacteria bacterium]